MQVKEKFLDYVSYHTTSDERSETSPSTACQLELGKHLKDELIRIGIEDASFDEYGYVYGSLKANCEGPSIGLVAHMDVSPQVSGKDIKPRIIENYDGRDIVLNETVSTTVERFPALLNYVGKTLIVTDGTTLLGADDKAGVAIIMETLEYLINHPESKHGEIRVCFTPDEEVGRGTEHFNYDLFKVDFAYTLDGGDIHYIEYECFNAASAEVRIQGISTHPGSAKNTMVNALNVAHRFHGMLPHNLRPEYTEGYEGFNHLEVLEGSSAAASMYYIIRNHDLDKLNEQKESFIRIKDFLNSELKGNHVEVILTDSYRNMKEMFEGRMESVNLFKKVMNDMGIRCEEMAIRGGTDGATITFNGIPCPNIGTGGENYHGVNEFCCVEDMEKMVEVLINLFSESCR